MSTLSSLTRLEKARVERILVRRKWKWVYNKARSPHRFLKIAGAIIACRSDCYYAGLRETIGLRSPTKAIRSVSLSRSPGAARDRVRCISGRRCIDRHACYALQIFVLPSAVHRRARLHRSIAMHGSRALLRLLGWKLSESPAGKRRVRPGERGEDCAASIGRNISTLLCPSHRPLGSSR